MTQPVSIANADGKKIDTLYAADGTRLVKVAVGLYAGAGDAEDGGAQAVGTHAASGAVLNATDAIVAMGGVDGSVGDPVVPLLVDSLGRLIISPTPAATGGLTPYKLVSAATTNATSVKASTGRLYSVIVNNVNAAVRYLKFYNKASAPTVGSDTPIHTLAIPAGTVQEFSWPGGLAFSVGIAFALTTEATDAGTTAVSVNEHVVNLAYA